MSQTIRIGSQIGPYDPFWVQVREAVAQSAREHGLQLVPIEITERPALLSPESQAALAEELLAQELDALICWNLPNAVITTMLDAGVAAIYLSESAILHPRFVAPEGLREAGRIVGAYLAAQLQGAGRILCVGGLAEVGGEDGSSRIAGLREALTPFPRITLTHIPSFWRYDQAYAQFMRELPLVEGQVDAIFGLSDSVALAARDAVLALGLFQPLPLIAGINGDPLALAAIAAGTMTATVETAAADFGRRALDLAHRAARREPLPARFSYNPRLVTRDNLADLALPKLIALADLPTRLVGVQRQLEQERLAQLEVSAALNRRVGALLDRHELAQEIARLIRANYKYDEVQLFLWSQADQRLVRAAPTDSGAVPFSIPLERAGLLAEALRRDEPIFIPDTHYHHLPPDPAWPGTRSRVILPIRLGDTLLGLLDLHSHNPTLHRRHELIGLQALADHLAIALRNADLYAEALQARAAAERADRLKTRLLANVGHELREPLNVIQGYTQAALGVPAPYETELPAALRQDLSHVYRSTQHLNRLINDLLDLSRAEIGALDLYPEILAPGAFLAEVFASAAGAAGEGVEWRLDLPDALPAIQADPLRLRQIVLNLLGNARKFTSRGQIALGAEVAPPYLELWVRDTGSGIPIEMQERIFEPFVTGEHPGGRGSGIGLGLSITRQLVALHGGTMTLESQSGQGSTFHVYLPLPSLDGQLPPAPPSGTARTLLVISQRDAPPPAIVALGRRQRLALYQIQADEDLSELLRQHQPVALAWDMADASPRDWTLIERLRGHPQLANLPFILYSAATATALEPGSGPTDVITKPVGGKTLLEAIQGLRSPDASGPVLVVDDDPEARALYRRLIAAAMPGYPVREASDGAAALRLLAQETPSLVLLDLTMPEIDGFAVLERLRTTAATRHVPVLVLSGRMLSYEDVRRLDYAHVVFQSKGLLQFDEAIAALRRARDGTDLPQPTSMAVKYALAYMHQNYSRDLSRQEIARAAGVSENYLSQVFRQEIGISPWGCLNRLRVERAKELLRNSAASVTAIAGAVGFDDAAYFSRVFSKHAGCSPQGYRQQPA